MPRKMTDAQLKAKILKADAEEKLRARVLELFREGKHSIAGIGAHPDVMRSKSTVQYIIKRFGTRPDTKTQHAGGRKTILTKRCPQKLFLLVKILIFRFF